MLSLAGHEDWVRDLHFAQDGEGGRREMVVSEKVVRVEGGRWW